MNLQKLQTTLDEMGQASYRLAQAKRAFYTELAADWDALSVFPKALRDKLRVEVPWDELKIEKTQDSADGKSVKLLLVCADGAKIESVLLRHEAGRNTVCVSSQVGCPMKCAFCATGALGFKRNLTRDEIAEQVIVFARRLKTEGTRVTNVVFMGMGEPFANYDETLGAARILNDHEGFDLGARHMTISTCGLVPGIKKFSHEPLQINLAISLHSAIPETRLQIMPVEKAYPLKDLMAAVDEYADKTNRKVLFEYLLLDGVNDSPRDAQALINLLKHNLRLYQVNLIKYHDTGVFKATPLEKRQAFMDKLKQAGILVTFRVSFGEDINAACGQLAGEGKGKRVSSE